MQFKVFALTLRSWSKPPPLHAIWAIDDIELAPISTQTLSLLNSVSLAPIHEKIRWQALAIQEFADLQDMTFPKAGRHFNINFFFFEGLSALREAAVAGINGGVHASLAVLRGVFEMFALHCYWKQRRDDEDTYDEFYRWFGGTEKAPGFGKLLDLCYAQSPPAAT